MGEAQQREDEHDGGADEGSDRGNAGVLSAIPADAAFAAPLGLL